MPPVVSEEYVRKKKKAILENALICFAEKGFHVATIDDIVAKSGISKGSIYTYFKSKEEMYLSIMNDMTMEFVEKIKEKFDDLSSSIEKINLLFSIYSRQPEINPSWKNMASVHLEFWLNASRDENIRGILVDRFHNVYIRLIADVIEEGKERGEFSKEADASLLATMFWGMIDGFALYYSVLGDSLPYQELIKMSKKGFFAGLLA